jgi:tRNA(fMet)-specific endonuclease VapC
MSLFVLDTDQVSLLRKGHPAVTAKVVKVPGEEIVTTIITFEELVSGWYSQLRQSRDAATLARAYAGLSQTLDFCRQITVLPFSTAAVERYLKLRHEFPRLGKQDLKIAAIVLEHFGVLVTRNRRDFESVAGLVIEDWSA